MQPEKKQLEILLMRYFRECYSEFPKSETFPSESPDFILRLKNKHHLGIELTRLHPGNIAHHEEIKSEINELRDHFISFARDIFEQDSPFRLFVKFLFSEKQKLKIEKEIVAAVQSVNAIRQAIQNRKIDSFFKISIHSDKLPPGLEEILVIHHPALKTSVWERANNLGLSDNVIEDVRQSIVKKDEKLRIYHQQHLNYYWLLVTVDRLSGLRNYNLPARILNHLFESRFQHVFLFDLMKAKVLNLV